jgi:predicted methyltransferase
MNPIFQRLLLAGYAVAQGSGILSTRLGRRALDFACDFYKARWEAWRIDLLRPLVAPGPLVIDVGANVGFFTRRFAAWTGPAGRVLAIVPEQVNFDRVLATTS